MRMKELSLRQDPDLRKELAQLARGCDFVLPSRFKKRLRAFQQGQAQVRTEEPVTTALSESIPKFYFPQGRPQANVNIDGLISKIEKIFSQFPNERATIEDMGQVAKACECPLYWKMPLFCLAGGDRTGFVSVHKFVAMWRKTLQTCHDDASKFVHLLAKPGCNYLEQDDFKPFLQDVVNSHAGLAFLKEAPDFHSRYITTVVQRIFYNVNRSWNGKITCNELRKSNFLQNVALLEQEEDVNQLTDFFSYEHFYVIYCKFWELDTDHDLYIDQEDLERHNDQAISHKMIERIFSGTVTRDRRVFKEGRLSYADFVWFLISDEDKKTDTSIEYWFRCMDLDGVDPGLAQTIQTLLLNRLGLQSQPDPRPGVQVPQYLLDLYRFHQQQYHLVEDPLFSFPSQHIQQANTVRSFHHSEPFGDSPTADDHAGVHISFNISSIPQDEKVLSAELRLLRSGRASLGSGPHRLNLYVSGQHKNSEPALLETRLLTTDLHSQRPSDLWEAFSLRADLLHNAQAGAGSLSFFLEVRPENNTTSLSDRSSSSAADEEEMPKQKEGHLRVCRSVGQNDHSWAQERPLLVTYSHDGHGEPLVKHGRKSTGNSQRMKERKGTKLKSRKSNKSRSRDQSWGRDKKKRDAVPEWGDNKGGVGWSDRGRVKRNGGRAAKLKRLSRNRCRRHPLYVDFNDVGWHKWIIAPSGYDAFFCLGECRFPLADHMNSSSHAMVQTLVNSVNGAVPRACCVPTSLSPIALLYLDPQDRVVLKNYQDMVVEGCGCR